MRHLTVCFAISCVLFATLAALSMDAMAQDQPDRQLKLFSLQNADAKDLLPIVHELFAVDGKVRMTCDARTNTLITSGPAADLEVIEAILMRLDVAVADRSGDAPETRGASRKPGEKDNQVTVRNPLNRSAIVTSVADAGQIVEKGEVIAVVESDQRDDHASLDIELSSLRAKAAQLTHPPTFEVDRLVAEQNINLTQLRLEHAKAELALEQDAINGEASTTIVSVKLLREALQVLTRSQDRTPDRDPREYIETRMELAKAEQQVALLEKRKKLHVDHVQKLRLAELQTELTRANLELRKIQQEANAHHEQLEAERKAVDIQMQLLMDRMKRLQDTHSKSQIHAPITGVVSRVGRIKEGASVRTQQPIIVIRPEE